MENGKKRRYSLKDLASMLDISTEAARAIGRNGLLNQILEKKGLPTTRCEDCRTATQWPGDAEEDLRSLTGE